MPLDFLPFLAAMLPPCAFKGRQENPKKGPNSPLGDQKEGKIRESLILGTSKTLGATRKWSALGALRALLRSLPNVFSGMQRTGYKQ